MSAKKSSKNQTTLPEAIITAFGGVDYFDVTTQHGRITLEPLRLEQGQGFAAGQPGAAGSGVQFRA